MTLPAYVPQEFKDALIGFARALKRNFAVPIEANPEDQLKAPMLDLLRAAAANVQPRTEAQVEGLGARPDIGVAVHSLLCGYVELKAPGKGARTSRLTGADKAQWGKFKVLPNLLYTDASEWALYRTGESQGEVVRFSGDVTTAGADAFTDDQIAKLHTLLLDFLSWEPIPPNSSQALAKTLAPLCRLLREDVSVALRNLDSSLAQLAREWRQYLFPDADDDRFADAYAQTLTYALLLARLSGEQHLTTDSAAAALDSGHGLLGQALRVLSQPQARQEIAVPVELLERMIQAVDPARLQQRGDPWLYFYEDFLSIYDSRLRNSYGVYYTPVPVIGVQVRLVSQLLREKFNKPLSYADEGVVFLDPAAGTAAYPLAAIQHALDTVQQRFGEGMVAAKATDCARNFNAFEILVGPYAVAHLRLTKLILDKGGTLPADGIRVYLTDTLESPHANPPQPPLFARVLTEEHRRAQRVKSRTRVLVCMGNPPYARESAEDPSAPPNEHKGGWVRYGDPHTPNDRPIFQDFIAPATAAGAGVHVKNLYNDYVYFWRWALWKLFENPDANGPGIISFITASSYVRGPGFVGMRQRMREAFDELWIIDLEGDQHGARKTENVFAIQTPVAIAIGVRYGNTQPQTPAEVHYAKITGTHDEKLAKLNAVDSFDNLTWQECMSGWMQPFLPAGEGDFFGWPLLTDLFPWQYSGTQFKRTWPVGETPELLRRRWETLVASPANERGALMRETGSRMANAQYESLLDRTRLPAVTQLPSDALPLEPVRYAFRSFDRQWILPDVRFCDRPRPALWIAHGERQVYMTGMLADVLGVGPAATATAHIPDLHHFCGRGGKDVIPLWRDSVATQPNLPAGLLAALRQAFGRDVTAEDVFAYAYAVLSTPAYVEKFSEELCIPGPRLPVTKDAALFARAVELGRQLLWLHTYGERFVPPRRRRGEIPQGRARCRQGVPTTEAGYPESFSYESTPQTLRVGDGAFSPVSDAVFNFSVSGLKVVESWLSYRMKAGAGRSSSPLDEIRPERWTGDMTQELLEMLWVLEATVDMQPELKTVFDAMLAGPTFHASDLPQPTAVERQPPGEAEPEPAAVQIELEAAVQQAAPNAPRQNTRRRRRRRAG
jgi:hypothetical protein